MLRREPDLADAECPPQRGAYCVFKRAHLPPAQLRTPRDVANYLQRVIGNDAAESFVALYLGPRGCVRGLKRYTSGMQGEVAVGVTMLLNGAFALRSKRMITVHNHPSGRVAPSGNDRDLWLRLEQAGGLVGIRTVDDLVIGPREFYSRQGGACSGAVPPGGKASACDGVYEMKRKRPKPTKPREALVIYGEQLELLRGSRRRRA